MDANKDMPASRHFINSILHPHAELAVDLLSMVGSRSTGDPSHRFQIAALIVFLSGVDKVLSLALQLMYLADRVEWRWLTRGHKLEPGVIECHQGLTAKLNKLHSLGLDLTDLQWIVDLRNAYIHTCSINAGYRVGIGDGDTSQFILHACGPEVSFLRPPLVPLGPTEIQTYAEHLTDHLGKCLDGIKWQAAWALLQEQLGDLPVNPEPEYSQVADASLEKIHSLTVTLNERYVGEGLRWLREQK
jgi:hypothetical protein